MTRCGKAGGPDRFWAWILTPLTLCAAMAFSSGAARCGEARFSSKPAAEKAGDKVKISFTLAAPTDVEVAVLGADGKVVRHLAAGVLGAKNPPPEPFKAGLSQALEWDLRDDFGKPAAGGSFKVRVRAGTGVKFGRTISDSPYMIAAVRGMATDRAGNVYVVSQSFGYGSYYCQVFDQDGKYLRTIIPFPVSLPREKVEAFSYWDEAGKRPVMRNYSDVYPYCLPLDWKNANLMMGSTDAENGIFLANGTHIYRFDRDGGAWEGKIPFSRLIGPERQWNGKKSLPGSQRAGGDTNMAVSPDGKRVYATLAYCKAGPDGKPVNSDWLPGTVYSLDLDGKGELQPWKTLETGPLGTVAVDARGNIYLLAVEKKQIVVLDPEGQQIGSLPAEAADQIVVHPANGEVYVFTVKKLAYQRYQKTIAKYSGFKDAKLLATHDLGVRPGDGGRIALSFDGKVTAVWVGGAESGSGRTGRSDVTRYEDRGKEFLATVKLCEKDPDALGNHDCIAVDRSNEEVYVNDDYSTFYRYNGLTGQGGALAKVRKDFRATDLTVGPDRCLYVRSGAEYSGPFERLDRDLKPVPFAGGSHVLSPYIYSRFGAGYGEKGIGVSRDGRSYLTFMYDWTAYCTAGFGPDGKALAGGYLKGQVGNRGQKPKDPRQAYPEDLSSAVIGPVPRTNGGVRVDSQGNLYLGVGQLPAGYKFPEMYAKDTAYQALVGSVVKFGPQGGEWIRTNDKTTALKAPAGKAPENGGAVAMEAGHYIVGAKQVYTGIGPFSGTYGTGRPSTGKGWCDCRSARFDLDMYDRLYLPNAADNSVRIYDNAGNVVLDFGGYANYDSQHVPAGAKNGAAKPAVPTAYVPLGWPIGTGVSEEHIYVCDQLNRCVVRADKTYAASETTEIK
jgi:DNA-binding beta-propeller fold protein YncE